MMVMLLNLPPFNTVLPFAKKKKENSVDIEREIFGVFQA